MMTVNSRSLVVQLHRCISKKPLEIIIGFGLFAGAFLNCDIAKYTFYILLLIAQLALIVKMIAINSRIRGLTINSIRYFIIIWIICLIMIDFLFQNVDVIIHQLNLFPNGDMFITFFDVIAEKLRHILYIAVGSLRALKHGKLRAGV